MTTKSLETTAAAVGTGGTPVDVARRRAALALAALPLAGCITIGNDKSELVAYRLDDAAAAPAARAQRIDRSLLVNGASGSSAGDAIGFAFSRRPGERAGYQFATWTDRPSARVAQLLVRRLEARQAFRAVALLGSGVYGDLVLNLTVDDIVHDVAREPGVARIEISANLLDRASRTLLARTRVEASAPVASANAREASQAMNVAVAQALDQLVPWLEAAAAASPTPPATPR